MDTGKFDVFHHRRNVNVFAVREGVGFAFQSVVEEAVDEERAIRGHAHGLRHVFAEHVLVVDDFHAAAAKHEARADHHRVAADLLDASEGFVDVCGHAAFRHRDAELIHHLAEQVTVFGDIDGVDARTENLHAFVGEGAGDVQRKTLWGVPAHTCAVGLYFRGDHLRFARYSPPKTKPCSRKH